MTQLHEKAVFILAWLPTPFMSRSTAEIAMDRIKAALRPGFYLMGLLHAAGGAGCRGVRRIAVGPQWRRAGAWPRMRAAFPGTWLYRYGGVLDDLGTETRDWPQGLDRLRSLMAPTLLRLTQDKGALAAGMLAGIGDCNEQR